MSYALDVNILLYASNEESAHHKIALQFLKACVEGEAVFYLPWPVLMVYLRIATHPSIFSSPLTPKEAEANISRLLKSSHATLLSEGKGFWSCYRKLTKRMVVRGNLVPDAHIAGILMSNGIRDIATNDSDFRRFESLRVYNPFLKKP